MSTNYRVLTLACALSPIWLAVARAQQSPPTIGVFFEIAAEPFKSNLSAAQREKIEIDVARELVRLCSDPIAYLTWQEARTTGPRTALKVVLRNEHAGYNDEIYLQYLSIQGLEEKEWPRDSKKTVYPPIAFSLPAHNPDQLEADLLSNIRTDFANQDTRKQLQERLATTVPISGTLTFDSATQRCILPLSWQSLQAADSSVLLARFQARARQQTQAQPVQIRMAPERGDNEIKCRVFEFNYPPTSLVVERARQLSDPKIAQSLRDKVGDAAVYMETYVRDFRANTSGSLNVTPSNKRPDELEK